jgi:hypothetical protein
LKNNNNKTRLVANPDALTLSRQPGLQKSEVTYQGPTGAFFFSGFARNIFETSRYALLPNFVAH